MNINTTTNTISMNLKEFTNVCEAIKSGKSESVAICEHKLKDWDKTGTKNEIQLESPNGNLQWFTVILCQQVI